MIEDLNIRVWAFPVIPYSQIWKKTPREAWAVLDERFDAIVAEYRNR